MPALPPAFSAASRMASLSSLVILFLPPFGRPGPGPGRLPNLPFMFFPVCLLGISAPSCFTSSPKASWYSYVGPNGAGVLPGLGGGVVSKCGNYFRINGRSPSASRRGWVFLFVYRPRGPVLRRRGQRLDHRPNPIRRRRPLLSCHPGNRAGFRGRPRAPRRTARAMSSGTPGARHGVWPASYAWRRPG